jgi:hypothetical protein
MERVGSKYFIKQFPAKLKEATNNPPGIKEQMLT